jgi:hypothetical protein
MKNLSFTNTAVFILFFGVAVIEAIQTKNWLKVAFWLAIGLVFLLGDLIKNRVKSQGDRNPGS